MNDANHVRSIWSKKRSSAVQNKTSNAEKQLDWHTARTYTTYTLAIANSVQIPKGIELLNIYLT